MLEPLTCSGLNIGNSILYRPIKFSAIKLKRASKNVFSSPKSTEVVYAVKNAYKHSTSINILMVT